MFHFLQNQFSASRSRRRRRVRLMPCETVESRLVLSAVNVLAPIELPPASVTATVDSAAFDDSEKPVDSSRASDLTAKAAFDLPQFEHTTPIQTDMVPQRIEISESGIDGRQDSPQEFVSFMAALDSFFGDFDTTQGPRRNHANRPPLTDSTGEQTAINVFDNTDTSLQRVAVADTQADVLTFATERDQETIEEEATTIKTDGFVEIPRATETTSRLNALLRDNLYSQQAANETRLKQWPLGSPNDHQATKGDAENPALQAALAFFNRQTDGGFVNAELDELAAAAAITGGEKQSASSIGLEAGLGRFNPFEDGSHTTMLAAVDLRNEAGSDASQANSNDANTNLALASLIVGSVGIGSSSSSKVLSLLHRFVHRLKSVIGSN